MTRTWSAGVGALFLATAATVGGCAKLCNWNGSSGAMSSNGQGAAAASHRPPGAFAEASGDADEGPPPTVNVFGEVNGASPNAGGGFSGEAAFTQHTFTDEGYDSDVAVDPTGKWLVFASTRNSEHPSLYLQRVDGSAVTQLTDGSADDAYPAFSPDGKRIAFSSTRAGNWQLFLMDTDGRNITQLTSGPMQSIHPSFSPDGSKLVYCAFGGRSAQWELWTLDVKGPERRMIGYGVFPVWSPSRGVDRIAFQRARQRGSRWFSLWTIDLIEGEGRRATEVAASSNAAILSPSWSPDGSKLAFATVVQPGQGGQKARGHSDIWSIEAEGSNRQRLTDGHGSNLMPFWAADNRVYFISDRGGIECVWSVRAEQTRNITTVAAPKKEATEVGAVDPSDAAAK